MAATRRRRERSASRLAPPRIFIVVVVVFAASARLLSFASSAAPASSPPAEAASSSCSAAADGHGGPSGGGDGSCLASDAAGDEKGEEREGSSAVAASTTVDDDAKDWEGAAPPPASASASEARDDGDDDSRARRSPDAEAESPDSDSDTSDESAGRIGPRLVVKPVLRVRNLTVRDFRERHSAPGTAEPLVFEGLGLGDNGGIDPSEWTRSKLREMCGDVPLKLTATPGGEYVDGCEGRKGDRSRQCHHVRAVDPTLRGKAWAGLAAADLGKKRGRGRAAMSTLADLLDAQDSDDEEEGGRGLYLHDAPLLHYCPPAMDALPGVPKYFRRDYNVLDSYSALAELDEDDVNFWDEYKGLRHFPSLFVGKGGGGTGSSSKGSDGGEQGTGSPLHADVGQARFWMLQLSGRKIWRIAPPDAETRRRLYPARPSAPVGSKESTLFLSDLFRPDFAVHPLLDGQVVYETITEPGDVLFLPEGWPHQVSNLDDSISVAYNFVDGDNLVAADEVRRRELRKVGEKGRVEEGIDYMSCLWGSFFVPLDDPSPLMPRKGHGNDDDNEGPNFVPFRKFFRDQNVRLMTDVPSSARMLFPTPTKGRRSSSTAVSKAARHRDRCGRPPLHAAASYGHVPLLTYLLDEVGIDPDLEDDRGWTALEILEEIVRTPDCPAAKVLRRRLGD